MEFKGTKGEWSLGYATCVVSDSSKGHIFSLNNSQDSKSHYGGLLIGESILDKHDAMLISASPELLKACQLAIKAFQELGLDPKQNCYKLALEAVDKALNETNHSL